MAAPGISGSPPRGRGKGQPEVNAVRALGITPAWAGKRSCRGPVALADEDHPRVGGEKVNVKAVWPGAEGSPPRGRGKGTNNVRPFSDARITPAWAGKSHHFANVGRMVWDHPRVGGEKTSARSSMDGKLGSPPRGRGKGVCLFDSHDRLGITPAWAGKSEFGLWVFVLC